MDKKLNNAINVSLCAVLIFQLAGCGTIMYPERKGQKSGKVDAGVAILDGIGLLFFLIPGVIAFAIDFNNGTIYLPGTFSKSANTQDIKEVKFDPKDSNLLEIERIIKEQTGAEIKLNELNAGITKSNSTEEMMEQFTQAVASMRDDRIAYVR